MNQPEIPADPAATLDLGRFLGQRRAFVAVGGRCSAAHAQLLQRIRDEKLYLAAAPTWRAFCPAYLAISRRYADYLISLLKRFGPIYFELSQLTGLSLRQYLEIEPAIRDQNIVVEGAEVSVIPENTPQLREAVDRLLSQSPKRPARPAPTFRTRLADLTAQGRDIANQLVDLYYSRCTGADRELVLEAATEIRMILMRPGLE